MSAPKLDQPFKDAGNHKWYVVWSEGRRSERVSTRTTDLAAAKKFLGTWLLMEHEQPASGSDFTCAEIWALYKAKHVDVKLASPDSMDFSWANLEPHFGALTLGQIDQDCVDAYVKNRRAGKSGRKGSSGTIRRELGVLRASWGWAANGKRKIITKALIPDFDMPEPSAPRDRWLKMPEMQALLSAAARMRRGLKLTRGERFLWLALETAARKQAILELTWDRVDFEPVGDAIHGVIHYDVPGRKKTKKGRASVPISASLRPVLERALAERENDLVMTNGAAIWATVQNIAIEAGMGGGQSKAVHCTKPKATGISPHVLRHTAATHMARRGVPLWIIAGILGNTVAMVEKVYGHHCPEGLASGVAKISGGVLLAAE